MGTINPRRESRTEKERHLNWMGGAAYRLTSPVDTLRLAAASSFFGEPMYYHRDPSDKRAGGKAPSRLSDEALDRLRAELGAIDPAEWRDMAPAALMESAIDAALDHDPEATLRLAVELRGAHNVRTAPQVILVRAAHHPKVRGTGLVRRYAREIVTRADEPSVGLAYHLGRYAGRALPNALKKAWALAIEAMDDRALAKYRMEDRTVKTVDVVNLVHPRGAHVDRLVRGELRTTGATWESIVSAEGSTRESWTKAIGAMGHMALLRNLRNLCAAGVDPSAFVERLVAGAENGRQLPFRYYSAHKALADSDRSSVVVPGRVLDAVAECLDRALGSLPPIRGRAMFLCDNSGSAWGAATSSMGKMAVAEIANVTAVIGGRTADDGHVGIFGDRLETVPVRRSASVFDQADRACEIGKGIGQSTENGIWLFWDRAIREKEHWDSVYVFSDMQAGHGGLYGSNPASYATYAWPEDPTRIDVGRLINAYRARVNQDVDVFLVQVAGHQDTILPEFYDRTYVLGGWSDGIFHFADAMRRMRGERAASSAATQGTDG